MVKDWRKVAQYAWMLDIDQGRGFYVICEFFPEENCYETTLVRRKSYQKGDDEHFVMPGDLREQFRELAPKGYKACIDFYCTMPIRDPKLDWGKEA